MVPIEKKTGEIARAADKKIVTPCLPGPVMTCPGPGMGVELLNCKLRIEGRKADGLREKRGSTIGSFRR